MILRHISTSDFPLLAKKYIETFSKEPWNETHEPHLINSYIQDIYSMNTFIGFIAEDEMTGEFLGVALGFIKPWYRGKEYVLDTFFIDSHHQSTGVGTQFLTLLKKELKDLSIPVIMLDTDKGMPAELFYEKNGFESATDSLLMFAETS